jgi:hypothetical protein
MSRGAARRLGYINHVVRRKGHDRYWHKAVTITDEHSRFANGCTADHLFL